MSVKESRSGAQVFHYRSEEGLERLGEIVRNGTIGPDDSPFIHDVGIESDVVVLYNPSLLVRRTQSQAIEKPPFKSSRNAGGFWIGSSSNSGDEGKEMKRHTHFSSHFPSLFILSDRFINRSAKPGYPFAWASFLFHARCLPPLQVIKYPPLMPNRAPSGSKPGFHPPSSPAPESQSCTCP